MSDKDYARHADFMQIDHGMCALGMPIANVTWQRKYKRGMHNQTFDCNVTLAVDIFFN